ncbi:MAG TPA: PLP-dependent aminotransferase family protein [Bryobacteraceae bacterium]|nr:PLP-dependent aminotransferase family protein [Bryobacteraceae bacterium]
MLPRIDLRPESDTPLYRQIYEKIRSAIASGSVARGEKLPPTRELAESLGLNRMTVASAYELLESDGLIRGHVGRGSFVEGVPAEAARSQSTSLDWESLIPAEEIDSPAPSSARISFSASRPSEMLFPLDEFRTTCREVIDSDEAVQILQLGPASGYGPLRRYLLEQARQRGVAGADDDILITSGCQQAFDLLQRVLASRGETVLLEDPVYPGLRNVFQRGGARVIGVPVGAEGIEIEALGRMIEQERPRLMVLTPDFQNPTGTTLPREARQAALEMARRGGVVVVENDLYSALRYHGTEIAPMKRLDSSGSTILLGSFSKIAFPGLRVGWAIGPRQVIARLTEAKQSSDLHSDQLSQAVLLRFAASGRLEAHRQKMLAAGSERLKSCIAACSKELPSGSRFTRPEGGMSLWVRLPEPLDAAELATQAERENVSFLPGRYFAVSRPQSHALRLSFAGLAPAEIRSGLRVLGQIFRNDFARVRDADRGEPAPAMV